MRIRIAALSAAALLGVLLTAVPAGARTADIVGGTAAPGSSLDPTGAFFQLKVTPGATVTQSFQVTNPNTHAITVRLAGVDGLTQSTTGAVFQSPIDKASAVGTWITPRDFEFQLGPKEARNEPFTVHVPIDAGPGVHLGGISAYSPLAPDSTATTQPGFHAQLNTQPARTIAVEVDLPGPSVPNLAITGGKPTVNGSGVGLAIHMVNSGTGYAHGVGEISVDETNTRNDFTVSTFVPATSIDFPTDWMTSANKGTYHVHAVVQYDGGRTAKWDGIVVVDDAIVAALKNVKVPDALATTNPPSKDGVDMLTVVAVAVGTVLALALLALLIVWLARRRRRGGAPQRSTRRRVESAPASHRDRDAVAPRRPSRRRAAEPEAELTRSERRHQTDGRGRHRRSRDDETLPRSARRR